MEKIGDVLGEVSIPINTRKANTRSSSDQTGPNAEFGMRNAELNSSSAKDEGSADSTESTPHSAFGIPHSQDVCPHCKGAGWLRMEAPVGDPRFGKMIPCVCRTTATEQRNLEDLYTLSNLETFQHKVFANFDPEVSGANEAYYAAADFATHPEGWLLLLGGYGSGKTHLAAAIAKDRKSVV